MSIKRQFLWSAMPLLVITAVNFFSVPMFLRYLGKEMYALWGFISTYTGLFGFADLGLGVAVGRYIGVALGKGDHKAVREYWGTANLVAIPLLATIALAFTGIGVWLGPKWFDKLSPESIPRLRLAFAFGGAGIFVAYYIQFWNVLSQAHLDFKFIGILRACFAIGQVAVMLWLAYLTQNPVVLIASGVGMGLLQLAIFMWHGVRKYHLGLNFREASLPRAREMSRYTLKTFFTLITGSFLGSIDRLLVGKFDPIAFASYQVCYNVGGRIQGLSLAIMGPVFHQTSRAIGRSGEKKSAASIYNETFDFTFGWYVLISIWVACWHTVFLRLWLGKVPGMAESVGPAFTPLVIAFCVSAFANNSGAQLGPLNRMGMQLIFTICNGVAVGFGVWFGWRWGGLVGVAWGVLASRMVLIAQDVYVTQFIGGGRWLSARTWTHLLMQGLVGLGLYYVAQALPHTTPPPGLAETLLQRLTAVRWQLLVAIIHGVVVAVWLFRTILARLWKTRFAK